MQVPTGALGAAAAAAGMRDGTGGSETASHRPDSPPIFPVGADKEFGMRDAILGPFDARMAQLTRDRERRYPSSSIAGFLADPNTPRKGDPMQTNQRKV